MTVVAGGCISRVAALSAAIFTGARHQFCERVARMGDQTRSHTVRARSSNEIRLAIVGDVHGLWSEKDEVALRVLDPDMTIFVGDIGNENVELVRKIAGGAFPKAVVLGNHDCFYTHAPAWRVDANIGQDAEEEEQDDVNAQLDILGDDHIGFSCKAVPGKAMTIVGARPFSWGGEAYKQQRRFYNRLYGLRSKDDYTSKIISVGIDVPQDHTTVMVGHSGPKGLGAERESICGVDFKVVDDLDFGDEDMKAALDDLQKQGRSPKLVTFGHMHDQLRGGGIRKRLVFRRDPDILYLNAAVVPRICDSVESPDKQIHHFCLVRFLDGTVDTASDVWFRVDEDGAVVEREIALFKREDSGAGKATPMVFNTHTAEWEGLPESDPSMKHIDAH